MTFSVRVFFFEAPRKQTRQARTNHLRRTALFQHFAQTHSKQFLHTRNAQPNRQTDTHRHTQRCQMLGKAKENTQTSAFFFIAIARVSCQSRFLLGRSALDDTHTHTRHTSPLNLPGGQRIYLGLPGCIASTTRPPPPHDRLKSVTHLRDLKKREINRLCAQMFPFTHDFTF